MEVGDRTNEGSTRATATAAKLEAAALALLERDGVLAGLNLQEVADAAGVNRALLYRYFGSRRELLRRAYQRSARGTQLNWAQAMEKPFPERYRWAARQLIERHRGWARIVFLLALDRDNEFRAMEFGAATLDALRRDREAGILPEDTDVEATHAFWFSALAGYSTLREQLSRELGIPANELDRRVQAVIGRVADAISTTG